VAINGVLDVGNLPVKFMRRQMSCVLGWLQMSPSGGRNLNRLLLCTQVY